MRISTGTGAIEAMAANRPVETTSNEEISSSNTAAAAASADMPPLQSAVLQPALAAMRDMPDIDHAKVAALRDALAKGEIPFNASRLAGLIQRFHGTEK
ncbi:flagellar biosynthesis anti-sigma factor FlgM [Undibacterium sp.]|jgi:negative regulator of flagellin synthesis FlgM|uniref:flagellar biosynthesis anti-sigma factor FlgM n=1 Tax=Undibacterium sp. TaxID=1914977 RepID=UPI002BE910A4|nr:flagellar biosynthesis anti-sigma factor FlgM [Undibacterium sp.]HTD04158.1 flagellar biosynthesis anti-sigma factor FlgM [Undibacterium sp.]